MLRRGGGGTRPQLSSLPTPPPTSFFQLAVRPVLPEWSCTKQPTRSIRVSWLYSYDEMIITTPAGGGAPTGLGIRQLKGQFGFPFR
jgi:hypothetical protein